jgi:hypothetical protein
MITSGLILPILPLEIAGSSRAIIIGCSLPILLPEYARTAPSNKNRFSDEVKRKSNTLPVPKIKERREKRKNNSINCGHTN